MEKNKPSMYEQALKIGRNVDVVVAAIAAWFGNLGAAALAGILAVIKNNEANKLKGKRLGIA